MTTTRPGFVPRITLMTAAMMGAAQLVWMHEWRKVSPQNGPTDREFAELAIHLEMLMRLLVIRSRNCTR